MEAHNRLIPAESAQNSRRSLPATVSSESRERRVARLSKRGNAAVFLKMRSFLSTIQKQAPHPQNPTGSYVCRSKGSSPSQTRHQVKYGAVRLSSARFRGVASNTKQAPVGSTRAHRSHDLSLPREHVIKDTHSQIKAANVVRAMFNFLIQVVVWLLCIHMVYWQA